MRYPLKVSVIGISKNEMWMVWQCTLLRSIAKSNQPKLWVSDWEFIGMGWQSALAKIWDSSGSLAHCVWLVSSSFTHFWHCPMQICQHGLLHFRANNSTKKNPHTPTWAIDAEDACKKSSIKDKMDPPQAYACTKGNMVAEVYWPYQCH